MWFLYVSIVVFNITAVFVKKNLRPNEFYVSILSGLLVSSFADRFTDKYNIYGLFDLYFIEAKSLLIYLGIYPAVTVLIIGIPLIVH
ncbi:hypothetical protein [Halalkalibacter hemicellulosilyticus]|uniref:Prepilin type IV endopeptidase peptidase domain-containing protein n=1 Tax=Halalkalibacter hemicellulosilyticusJCM 9152 TaxID=1236971 RepID=W4QAM1_9BACI|nr:hypothetical protein [Halalkalibacter hemicellulosilyticus]GAE29106.1 hypothetical protein JCM9152_447 [Halalkalibacter hemicellulosilyticusJCM 9152]